jgi:hypothetical protein
MKTLKLVIRLVITALIVAPLFILLPGCEKDANTSTDSLDQYFADHPFVSDPRQDYASTTPKLSLSQSATTITYAGQKVVFTVTSGGDSPFTWWTGSAGSVAAQPGNDRQATYTAGSVADNSVVVYDKNGYSAIGYVSVAAASTLSITPSSQIFTSDSTNSLANLDGKHVQFHVTGGVVPYGVWAVSLPEAGGIDTVSGLYTVTTVGLGKTTVPSENLITITDNDGNIAQATVTTKYLGQ